ncbi:unnamed protein product [Orchesella dallaii]|uniref:DNA-directed RNA polymerase II subunit GRINL1A n=1 Tax=Orchesella dallaii TaxID=48710 RepID=A0ABP1QS67_9HEXA
MSKMDEQPTYALVEQVTRQKGILSNPKLIQKLPDKGAKLRDSLSKIEEELLKRREAEQSKRLAVADAGKLEWTLRSSSTSSAGKDTNTSGTDVVLDSDDDEETNSESQNPLQIIATSQITQRQPKPTIPPPDNPKKDAETDLYVVRLIRKDLKTAAAHISNPKFTPAKSVKSKGHSEENPYPAKAKAPASPTGAGSSSSIKPPKWDECLLPPTHTHKTVALLSMEETVKMGSHQYNKAQELQRLEAKTKVKKKYAYDKLMEEGILSNYTVEMQTSRPVRTDADDDNEFEEDLFDGISEESESNDSDGDNDEASNDLSSLVNSSLKLKS